MDIIASIKVKSELKKLEYIRTFIVDEAIKLGLTLEAAHQLRLAVDEACSNIIIHGYQHSDGIVEVVVYREKGAMVVHIKDKARSFNPLSKDDHPDFTIPLSEREVGGMGIFLIHQNTDSVAYRSSESGENVLILTKS